jgi:hypothetical protein
MAKLTSVEHAVDDTVKIVRADKKIDPNVYRVVSKDRNLTFLESESTGVVTKVHYTRVIERLNQPVNTEDSTQQAASGSTEATTTSKASKTRKAKSAQKFDFKTFMSDKVEAEHWSRSAKANVQKKTTRTHAILYKEGDNWRKLSFNTYDGCLGPKGKLGEPYSVKSHEKAVALLGRGGYKKVTHA